MALTNYFLQAQVFHASLEKISVGSLYLELAVQRTRSSLSYCPIFSTGMGTKPSLKAGESFFRR